MSLTLFAAVIALGNGQQADLSQKVTFSHSGASLPVVLGELGNKAKVSFDVHPDVASEVIFLQVKDQPLKETLDRVAAVCGAKWFDQNGVIKVIVDPQARAKEAQQVANDRLAGVRAGKKRLVEMSKPKKIQDGEESYDYEPSAGILFANEVMAQIPDQTLAALNPGDRIVFATSPTRMQRQLPRFNMARLNAWIKQHNDSLSEMGTEQMPPEFEEIQKLMGDRWLPKKFEGQPSEMMLIVSSTDLAWGSGLSGRLVVFDEKGRSVIEESIPLGAGGGAEEMMEMAVPIPSGAEQTKPDPDQKSTPIKYPDEIRAFAKEMETGRGDMGTMSPKMREVLMRPDVYEPLAIPFGNALVHASAQQGANMVGTLDDENGMFSSGLIETVESLEATIAGQLDKSQAGWWIVKPKDPGQARLRRVDRTLLARFLSVCANGSPTLDQYADFLASTNDVAESSFVTMRIQMVRPGLGGGVFGGMDNAGVRMYGLLTLGQRAQLKQGRPVPFAGLSQRAKAHANRMMFGAAGAILTEFDPNAPLGRKSLLESFPDMMGLGMGGGIGELRFEPTEVMPDGLPGNGFLSAVVEEKPYVMALDEKGGANEMSIALGVDELAMFRLMMQQPEFAAEGQNFLAMFDHMQRGVRDEWTVRMHVAATTVRVISLDDLKPVSGDKFSLRQLPTDLEATVSARAAKMKDSPLFKMIAMGATSGEGQKIKP